MTEPLFRTTGRPMTRSLENALADITGAHRRAAITALRESTSPTLARVHRALSLELALLDLAETDQLDRHEQDRDQTIPEPPYPPATGSTWWPEGGDAA